MKKIYLQKLNTLILINKEIIWFIQSEEIHLLLPEINVVCNKPEIRRQ